jgi:tRNA(Ile)-lysidine synthase
VTQLALPLDTSQLKPGLRLAVGLSGGADSVALTRALAARASELGVVLHAAHLHHGLRAEEADQDRQFAAELAQSLGLVFHTHQVDTAQEAAQNYESGKSRETIEEAARRLRYAWFRQLMSVGKVDAIATAHTLDDQAETVLGKFLRGAWTEGLSGIHPVVTFPEGRILRPLLAASRPQVEAYLASLGQPWREDASNRDPAYTRNRLRHQLLPELEQWNPRIREHLANMAELARDEEAWWQAELARLAPQQLLTGRAVRGGGRAGPVAGSDDGAIAMDMVRLKAQPPALQRRLLRHAAATLGVSLGFDSTENLRSLVTQGRAGQQLALPGPLAAERTSRELRLSHHLPKATNAARHAETQLPVPGEAAAFGWRFCAQSGKPATPATIRIWRPGDRVTLRYSSGPRKIKEVLERLKVTGTARAQWPIVEWEGHVIWMQGAELQPIPGLSITAEKE